MTQTISPQQYHEPEIVVLGGIAVSVVAGTGKVIATVDRIESNLVQQAVNTEVGWAKSVWGALTGAASNAASFTADIAQTMIDDAIGVVLQTVAGPIQLAYSYADAVGAQVVHDLNAPVSWLVGAMLTAQDELTVIETQIERWVTDGIDGAIDAIPGIIGALLGLSAGIEGAVQRWVLNDVVPAIDRTIIDAVDGVQAGVDSILGEWLPDIYRNLTSHEAQILGLLAGLAALGARVAALEATTEECTQPMCDAFGPKTDAFKALKALEALIGAWTAGKILDLHAGDLVTIANTFGGIGSGSVVDFATRFASGGASLGDAGATVLGDLGDIGTGVLHELGIPLT